MADHSTTPEQFGRPGADRPRQLLDLLAYVVGMLAVLFLVLGAISWLLGAGLIGIKYGLFVVGTLMFGLGSLKLRPVRPGKDQQDKRFPIDRGDETPLQARVQRLLPKQYRLDHDDRLSDGVKLFVASIAVLAVSFVMEMVFGVGVS